MTRLPRLLRWTVYATAVLLLFWVCATLGSWSPNVVRMATGVHGASLANYQADSPLRLAPLSPLVINDANRDREASPTPGGRPGPGPSPGTSGSASPIPSTSGSRSPSPSGPIPSLPVATPTLPPPPTPLATPTLPTPPPLP